MKQLIKYGLALSALFAATSLHADDRFASVEIKSNHLAGSVHMLTGAGGNIGVSAGEDGVLSHLYFKIRKQRDQNTEFSVSPAI